MQLATPSWHALSQVGPLILTYLILSYLSSSYLTRHPQLQLHPQLWPACLTWVVQVSLRWVMILCRMGGGLPRPVSPSCPVTSGLTSAGRFQGVFGLRIPYICTYSVREGNVVANAIRVSSTSCYWAPNWFFITPPHLLPLSSSPSLLLVYSGIELLELEVWKVFHLLPPSHVAHMLNIRKENGRQSKAAVQGTLLVLPAAAGPLQVSSQLFSVVQRDDVLMVLLILIS